MAHEWRITGHTSMAAGYAIAVLVGYFVINPRDVGLFLRGTYSVLFASLGFTTIVVLSTVYDWAQDQPTNGS